MAIVFEEPVEIVNLIDTLTAHKKEQLKINHAAQNWYAAVLKIPSTPSHLVEEAYQIQVDMNDMNFYHGHPIAPTKYNHF